MLAFFLWVALLPGIAAAQWTQLSPAHAPSGRYQSFLVYDSARDRHVLFGGSSPSGDNGDTWEFDGTDWSLRSTSGPAARDLMAMVYDSNRHVTVLFGGVRPGVTFYGDTWEWDGNTWTLVTSAGPSARAASAIAYDSKRQRVVLFGGFGTNFLGETWEYDGHTWTQLNPTVTPTPRGYAGMDYDPILGKCVMYGGGNNESWEWDGANWRQVLHGEAPERGAQAQVYDSARRRSVIFGGNYDYYAAPNIPPGLWEFDGSQWRTLDLGPGPGGRNGASFDYDSKRNMYLLFGSQGPGIGNLNGDTWTLTLPPFSPASLAFAPNSVVGGQDSTCTITLNSAAGNGPVKLSSNSGLVAMPPSVLVPPGQDHASFTIHTGAVTSATTVTIYASINNQTISATLTVTT